MVVHDRSYARWDGDRERHVAAGWVITERGVVATVSALFKRKLFAQLLTLVGFAPFLFAVGLMYTRFFVMSNPQLAHLDGLARCRSLRWIVVGPDCSSTRATEPRVTS